ncbi:MAG: universal stress protein [Pseudomonadota bacterium]
MSSKTILIVIQSVEEVPRLLSVAATIARDTNAHLIGLHVAETMILLSEAAYLPVSLQDQLTESQTERAAEIDAAFTKATAGETFVSEFRFEKVTGATSADHIIEQARCADLVIMAQQRSDADNPTAEIALERTIRKSGRPVLVIPYAGDFEVVGKNAIVGWSATREATRAAHDAVGLIGEGSSAYILTVRSSRSDDRAVATAKELAQTYDRHGIKAEVAERLIDDISIADVLLNEAFERGADLIVTGAFGHSRIYDFVIGATTTKLLESMTAPVLFSS